MGIYSLAPSRATPIPWLKAAKTYLAVIHLAQPPVPLPTHAGWLAIRAGAASPAASSILRHALKRAGHHLNIKRRRDLGRNSNQHPNA